MELNSRHFTNRNRKRNYLQSESPSLFDKTILIPAIWDSFRKLDPRLMVRNPVMFVAMVGAVVTTAKLFYTPLHGGDLAFFLQIALWLWFTVLFANFAEAMAEGRGKAQAATLRQARTQTMANQAAALTAPSRRCRRSPSGRATSSWSWPGERSRRTAKSSRARPRWMSRPLPGSRRRSSARPAATGAR